MNNREKLIAFIKHQINIDISPLIHKDQSHPRRYLGIDLEYDYFVPNKIFRALLGLEQDYKSQYFKISPNGGLGIALVYGPAIKNKKDKKP